jgi:uncharacterized protein (DUF58 family)
MEKPLKNLPVLNVETFQKRAEDWKRLPAGPGADRVVVEWSVGLGPKVFVYPASKRAAGFSLLADLLAAQSDERWADFLEFTFVPQVVEALKSAGHKPQVICVDLRPVQTMRTRRRAQEEAAHAKSGHTSAH